ncbi:S8 family peptidase [Planktothrix rubescens]|uniref:S8 family peptidase n=1 Tax=Planktothrix rubescens TaxID=59512 RepID=UPI000419D686|nr:PatA/PatG family cyanobactin maturation protease [Planktothrix rubescens]
MDKMTNIPGLKKLWSETRGDPKICVAVLDGIVDQTHPCFDGADLTRLPSLVSGEASENGSMSAHGTHVASIIFGQPDSPVEGIAPHCRGLIVPVFADESLKLSQLDLSRAIEQAVNNGANIINVSAGQLTDAGEADTWLEKAIQLCQENNVLLIAATGNDGCECLHVPASLPTVLAVGAMDDQGKPVDFSNWGDAYQKQGILAPGKDILGAKPNGGTIRLSGTSFATPIVSGVAALLLSLQIKRGEKPDPQKVKNALLASATPCNPKDTDDQSRCLMGKLNILDAIEYLTGETMSEDLELESVEASGCGCQDTQINESELDNQLETASEIKPDEIVASVTTQTPINIPSFPQQTTNQPTMSNRTSNFVTASEAPSELEGKNLVYALGVLGYDFGSEARRDSFKQLMPGVSIEGTTIPSNPYDARQMVDYLGENLPEAKALIWTLNLELTPIYAIEPVGGFSRDVYEVLQGLLSGQIQEENSPEFVQRVSIPGVLTGRSVKLFSGQVVPVIEINNTRGLYGWKVNSLVTAAIASVQSEAGDAQEDAIRRTLSSFLNRIYYDLRNLGTTSQDRALNFASTNAFQAAQTFAQAVGAGYELDSITVEKSPFCRLDSDCWDVKLKFFDPENSRRAKKIYRFTIDVSDTIPVTLGEVRSWSSAY